MPLHKCAAGKKLSKLFNSNLPHFDFPSLKPVVSFKTYFSYENFQLAIGSI